MSPPMNLAREHRLDDVDGAGRRRRTAGVLVALVAAIPGCAHVPTSERTPPARSSRLLDDLDRVAVDGSWDPSAAALPEAGLEPAQFESFEQEIDPASWLLLDGATVGALLAGGNAAPATAGGPTVGRGCGVHGSRGLHVAPDAGAAIWIVPMRGGSPCLLRLQLRAGATAGARVRVFEVPRVPRPDPAELLALVERRLREARSHVVPLPPGTGSFQEVRCEFETSPATAATIVVFTVDRSPDATGESGLDVDEIALFGLTARRHLAATGGSAPAGNARVRRIELGGETRRALLAPPPTTARFAVELPRGPFRIAFGYGVIDETRPGFGTTPLEFEARLEQGDAKTPIPLPRARLDPVHDVLDCGWHDARLDGVGDGGPATLVLETRVAANGEAHEEVALFGEPRVLALADAPPRANVLLVSLDTLRADHLGFEGYRRSDGFDVSPRLDRLAASSLEFRRARSFAPYTLPAHASLFTGVPPQVHGVLRPSDRLRAGVHSTLAAAFAAAGYATAAFTSGGFLDPAFGMDLGFDRYSVLDPLLAPANFTAAPRAGDAAFNAAMHARCDEKAIGRFLLDHRDEPFFLFVHSYVAHNYRPAPDVLDALGLHELAAGWDRNRLVELLNALHADPTDARAIAALTTLYDGAIHTADRAVGAILDRLDEAGLAERTLVVVTSDHGDELLDHGGLVHGHTLFEEMLHVPLLVRVPGVAPAVVDAPVQIGDVAPTLLAAAGLPPLPAASGVDLVAVARHGASSPDWTAHLDTPPLPPLHALGRGRWKLIRSPARDALFDLESDPRERVDRSADPAAAEPLAELRMRLDRFEEEAERRRLALRDEHPAATEPTEALDAERIERLLQLGYAAGDERPIRR
jgi:arylsulfatase A-like enzyme